MDSSLTTSNRIQLHFKAPQLVRLSFAKPRPEAFKRWIEQLPFASTGQTARILFKAVSEFNQLQIDYKHRYLCLEVLRPAIFELCNLLDKQYLNSRIYLDTKAEQATKLAQALQWGLATGYKIATNDLIAHGVGRLNQKWLALSAHRFIHVSGHVLLRSQQLYSLPPRYLWGDLHQIFGVSTYYRLSEKELPLSDQKTAEKTTSRVEYLRCLVLATQPHNRMTGKEMETVFLQSVHWLDLLKFGDDVEHADFKISPNLDLPPKRTGLKVSRIEEESAISTKPWFINTSLLSQKIAQDPGRRGMDLDQSVSNQTVGTLIQTWGERYFRQQERFTPERNHEQACMVVGLTACHYFFAGRKDMQKLLMEWRSSDLAGEDSAGKEDLFRIDRSKIKSDIWNNAFDAGGGTLDSLPDVDTSTIEFMQASPIDTESDIRPKFPIHRLEVKNYSSSGACLSWKNLEKVPVRLGEIVAVEIESSKGSKYYSQFGSNWRLGILQWVKRKLSKTGANDFYFGVSFFNEKAELAAIKAVAKTGEGLPFQPAFLLAKSALNEPSILVDQTYFKGEGKGTLNRKGKLSPVHLSQPLIGGRGVERFHYRELEQKVKLEEERESMFLD